MKITSLSAVAVAAAALTIVVAASAHEKSIKLKDLPEAVRKTALEQSKGGRIIGLSVDVEDGKTVYEAELKLGARRLDVSIDQAGALLESEERVALAELPAPVKAGLEKAAGKGKITMVEAISKNGAVAEYEAQVRAGARRFDVKVAPDGGALPEAKK